MKDAVTKNKSFLSSELENNNQGCDFCLKGKIKRQNDCSKGKLSNETWRRVSRSFDKSYSICKHTKKL